LIHVIKNSIGNFWNQIEKKHQPNATIATKQPLYYIRPYFAYFKLNNCSTRCDCIQFIYISVDSSTCFRCWQPSSSGAPTTVITASGTGQPGLLPSAVIVELELICLFPLYVVHIRTGKESQLLTQLQVSQFFFFPCSALAEVGV